MNLPNKLTMLRVLLVPVFVLLLLWEEGAVQAFRLAALAVFCIASFTDFLDGQIARRCHLVTNFGKFMDPLADKLLVCSGLVCLIQLGQLPAWYVILVIAREFIISGFRLVAAGSGVVIAASWWGKLKTVSQMLLLMLLILKLPQLSALTRFFYWLSLLLSLLSLFDYIAKNRRVITEGGM
ncbi:MAG: CDP-diacylglycerol--glycerol-3-phosphate 3-phosphatidyltransferase [Oribacterium sp.]